MKIKIFLSPLLMKMGTDGLLTSAPDFRISSSLLISFSRCSSRSYQTLDPKPQIRLVVISLVLSPLTSGLYQEPGREASEQATALCIYYLSSIFSMTSRAGSVRRPRASLSSVTLFCKVLCCTLGLTFSVLLAICSRMCCSLSGTFICSSLF